MVQPKMKYSNVMNDNDINSYNKCIPAGEPMFEQVLKRLEEKIHLINERVARINHKIELLVGVDYRESIGNNPTPVSPDDNSNLYGSLNMLDNALGIIDSRLNSMSSHIENYI